MSLKGIIAAIGPVLKELVTLQRPAVAASVVTFIVAVIPGLNASAALLTGILVVVGTVAAIIEKAIEAYKSGKPPVAKTPFKLA